MTEIFCQGPIINRSLLLEARGCAIVDILHSLRMRKGVCDTDGPNSEWLELHLKPIHCRSKKI